jgi:hypothetical protein
MRDFLRVEQKLTHERDAKPVGKPPPRGAVARIRRPDTKPCQARGGGVGYGPMQIVEQMHDSGVTADSGADERTGHAKARAQQHSQCKAIGVGDWNSWRVTWHGEGKFRGDATPSRLALTIAYLRWALALTDGAKISSPDDGRAPEDNARPFF